MDIFAFSEDPLSDLSAKFLKLIAVDTFAGFTCADYEGEYIYPCVQRFGHACFIWVHEDAWIMPI